ncbi:uncharacterized protein LOC110455967 [Mizuhopecten yessoensis]|uniref:uncharacterized protein LOC110455967 n=1 Tax=Mizuhopecten yessoensis TaxID=6573 RepID=UPI000B4592EC|nr:uncharacterized protein LOC110455967 [Mizuhopecten yessoensis]
MDKTSNSNLGVDVQKLVTIHKNATRQLQLIDMQLESLTRKVFDAQLNGDRGFMLQLMTRKSVLKGVRRAYSQFIQNKASQITELCTLTLTSEGSESNNIIAEITSAVSNHVLTSDDLAPAVTETFCLFSRCS